MIFTQEGNARQACHCCPPCTQRDRLTAGSCEGLWWAANEGVGLQKRSLLQKMQANRFKVSKWKPPVNVQEDLQVWRCGTRFPLQLSGTFITLNISLISSVLSSGDSQNSCGCWWRAHLNTPGLVGCQIQLFDTSEQSQIFDLLTFLSTHLVTYTLK